MKNWFDLRAALLGLVLSLATALPVSAQNPGNAWHIPDDNHDVDADTGSGSSFVYMRDPRFEFALGAGTNTALNFYQAVYKGGGDNETGGKLWYRTVSAGGVVSAWASVTLNFFSDEYNSSPNFRQVWKAALNSGSFNADDVIQYYFEVTFSNRDTTFLYGGDADPGLGNQRKTTVRTTAEAAPYSVHNRPAFVFHAGNRVLNGNSVQFYAKVGYQSKSSNVRWADHGALYYTTDGTDPAGALGVAGNGSTQVATLGYDHPENDNSAAGNAMWWVSPSVTLPTFTTVKYKISFWNAANNEEKFADYNAPTDAATGHVFSFSIGTVGEPNLTVNGVSANYTTTHLFINEINADQPPLNIVFEPGQANVDASTVQVFTNLNRRDKATLAYTDAGGLPTEEGIQPPSGDVVGTDDSHYYRAYPMTQTAAGHYELTLPAFRTGAYRLTARYKLQGGGNWIYYTTDGRRDHAVVVSPTKSRDIVLYEANVLNANATGTLATQRGTFADLNNSSKPVNLDSVQALGCNFIWFQPIHPNGIDGRQTDPTTNQPYEVGSPYAVKNFFEVMELMGRTGSGDATGSRAQALQEFQSFVAAADAKGVGVMLDAPFNHTSYDAELAAQGVSLISPGGSNTDQIRNREARFYSLTNSYYDRASGSGNIAVAPDRGDFGKFGDTYDVFYGSYSALVNHNDADNSAYLNEGDTFFYGDTDWTAHDFSIASQPQNVTRNVWRYFSNYILNWLDLTGCPAGTPPEQADKGIDALRADFGQGLPPQAWEYIINVARTRKWNFVFMTESLDGGAVTYRSNRHFDILNENIIFPFKSATTTQDYRNIFDGRRSAYGQGLVLMNSTSHDEESYDDPFEALIRYTVAGTVDGVPMIFYGQELGISRQFGFDQYETNFGKQIAHFKKFNSLGPIRGNRTFGLNQLAPVFAAVGQARSFSSALRSSNRYYLNQTDNSIQTKVFSVAKYSITNASPNVGDVVFAFANLDRNNDQQGNFNVNISLDSGAHNLFGIKRGRQYNVRNLAAYTALDANRRNNFLIPGNATGDSLLDSGLFVALKRVPTQDSGWSSAPFEAQYLKLYDVTPPPTVATPANATAKAYALGHSITFTWPAVSDPDGGVSGYRLIVRDGNGNVIFNSNVGNVTSYTLTGQPFGSKLSASVVAINNAGVEGAASANSAFVTVLDPSGDQDGDGVSNGDEDVAGTDLFDVHSYLRVLSTQVLANNGGTRVTWSSVPGKTYVVQTTTDLQNVAFADLNGSTVTAAANTTQTSFTDTVSGGGPRRFYRVRVVP